MITEIFKPDYEAITKLLEQFNELYKNGADKKMLDELLLKSFGYNSHITVSDIKPRYRHAVNFENK